VNHLYPDMLVELDRALGAGLIPTHIHIREDHFLEWLRVAVPPELWPGIGNMYVCGLPVNVDQGTEGPDFSICLTINLAEHSPIADARQGAE